MKLELNATSYGDTSSVIVYESAKVAEVISKAGFRSYSASKGGLCPGQSFRDQNSSRKSFQRLQG